MMPRSNIARLLSHLVLLIVCGLVFLPIYWMFVTAIQPNDDIFSSHFHLFPYHVVWSNFVNALTAQPFGRFFLNSFLMSGLIVLCQLITSSLAAYALTFMRLPARRGWLYVVLLAMMVPMQATFIPIYLILSQVHLINTMAGLVLPFVGSAFGIFLLRQGFASIPRDLVHAARLDGASEWRILLSVILPNAKPSLVTLALLNFVFHYNDLFWPLVSTNTTSMRVIPVALSYFLGQETGQALQWNWLMAADFVCILPVLLLFLIGQRYIVRGLMSSAVKG